MRKFCMLIIIIILFVPNVQAMEFTAPEAPKVVQDVLPREASTFGQDLWYVVKKALSKAAPDLIEAVGICVCLIGILFLISILQCFKGIAQKTVELAGTICVAVTLLLPTRTFINLGIDTVQQLSEYGKLLLPVMTGAMAAQGGIGTATGLYVGTVLFNTILSTAIAKLLIPMVYIYTCLSVASSALGEQLLNNLRDFMKWLVTWCLKILMYLFTGYIGITGVISGTVDTASVKATKLAISGFVPVVGSVISDASETILVSAAVMKNTVGIYGLLVLLALCVGPFVQIGVQYLLLRLCGALCGVFDCKTPVKLIESFASVMGFLLAMTGCVCLLHMVSTVCLMKGVG